MGVVTKIALEARPHASALILGRRKGFVKIALSTGTPLVPVFAFGENEVFDQVENPRGSLVRRLQEKITRTFGVSTPLFKGRGIFNYSFGILPRRNPLLTVVGSPIDIPKVAKPDLETIEKYHKIYIKSITELFEKCKEQAGFKEDEKLILVG